MGLFQNKNENNKSQLATLSNILKIRSDDLATEYFKN